MTMFRYVFKKVELSRANYRIIESRIFWPICTYGRAHGHLPYGLVHMDNTFCAHGHSHVYMDVRMHNDKVFNRIIESQVPTYEE